MMWLFIAFVLVAVSPTSKQQPLAIYYGKFQLDETQDDYFSDWLKCAGFKPEIEDIIQNPKIIFEIEQVYTADTIVNQLTLTDLDSEMTYGEHFKFGKEFETDYFGSGKVTTKVEAIDYKTLKRTLQLGGKQSQVFYDFSNNGCKIRYDCGAVRSQSIYKRISI